MPVILFSLESIFPVMPAYAGFKLEQSHTLPKSRLKEQAPTSNNEPVLLTANQVEYDQQHEIVYARGKVEITQGDTIVLADTLVYNRDTGKVSAEGNVSMLEPSGNVYFANAVELQDDLKSGVIHQFRARLVDDSVTVASGARKIDENTTELFKAAYTPCKCDHDGQPHTPFWSIKADSVTIDQEAQEIRYDNASLNLFGVPVFYTPYFSHSTPNAENESGLLVPDFLQSRNLGTVYKQPIYYSIAEDKDITLTPIYASKAGPILVSEYRQKFDDGGLNFTGSITNAPNTNAQGESIAGHELRGHVDTKGKFDLGDNYDWGFNIRRASDDTYLHLYNFNNEPLLTSRVYAEGFNFAGDSGRNYASVEGLSFQGLTGQDNAKVIPVVAPLTNVSWQSSPGYYNSRFTLDGNAMVLYRQAGDESRRVSGTAGWQLPYLTDNGQIFELETQLRTDIYDISNLMLSNGRTFNGVTGREIPQVSLTWRYPFINHFQDANLTLEPITNFTISPGGGNPEKIPNEDSALVDFNDANLFSSERFSGLDRVENGPRMSYGLRGQAQVFSTKYVDWLVGQQYRVINDPNFPITNDLKSNFSDYVGKIGLTYHPFTLSYRFRADKDNFTANRSEVDASFNEQPFSISTSYLSLKNDPVLSTREVINANGAINLTDNWSVTGSTSRDLHLDQMITAYTGLAYKNECASLTTMVGKDYTSLLDIKPSLTFWFRISLKNLD